MCQALCQELFMFYLILSSPQFSKVGTILTFMVQESKHPTRQLKD